MRYTLLLLMTLALGCETPHPEGARRDAPARVTPTTAPATPVAETTAPTRPATPLAVPTPAPKSTPPAAAIVDPTQWTYTVRPREVLMERAGCAISWRLGKEGTSLSLRASCPGEKAPSAADLSHALERLLAQNPGALSTLKWLWCGPIERFDDGRWARTVGAAAVGNARWKPRSERRRGDPGANAVYVEIVNGSDALAPLREVFAPHGLAVSLESVEKVFIRPASAFEGLAKHRARKLPYDAGRHSFSLSPKGV